MSKKNEKKNVKHGLEIVAYVNSILSPRGLARFKDVRLKTQEDNGVT
jgi:hypothetical protein